jgi:hypothetical protein
MNISNIQDIYTTSNWYILSTLSLIFILSFLCLKNKVNNFLNRQELRNNINENDNSETDDNFDDNMNETLENNKENNEEILPPNYNDVCKT